jgi:hypothetical protein
MAEPPAPESKMQAPPPPVSEKKISTGCDNMHRSDSETGLCWRSGAFAGEFGDVFIKDTNLEGGQVAPSIEYLAHLCETITLADRRSELTLFSDNDMSNVLTIIDDLKKAAKRDRVLDEIRAKRGASSSLNNVIYADLLQTFVTSLSELAVGQRVVISGGWSGESGGHAIMHCVEREQNGMYAIVTFNTGEGAVLLIFCSLCTVLGASRRRL